MTYTEEQDSEEITLGQRGNQLFMLIAICLICFVGFAFMKAMWYFRFPKETALPLFYTKVFSPFALPADTNTLITKPWAILTFMFTEDNVWKIFANMLWAWCFGSILQVSGYNKKILPLFIYGSLGGAFLFTVLYNLVPSLSAQLPFIYTNGAAAGVIAIAVAATMLTPGYRFFPLIGGGIPLWVLSIFYMASAVFVAYDSTASIIMLAGGAAAGVLFIIFLRMGYDGSRWMNNLADWFSNLFNPDKPAKGKNIKDELFYKSTNAPYTKKPNPTQERIDAILDKINQQGYSSLTEEEKDLLKQSAKEK